MTSSIVGMDGTAPARDTAMADAFAAMSSASGTGLPSLTAHTK